MSDMPANVQLTLYRALVHAAGEITAGQQETAWRWLDDNTPDYDIRDT